MKTKMCFSSKLRTVIVNIGKKCFYLFTLLKSDIIMYKILTKLHIEKFLSLLGN